MTTKDKIREAIETHGRNLQALFTACKVKDPVILCRKLRRLETEAARTALAYCNGNADQDALDKCEQSIMRRLEKLLHPGTIPVSMHDDPRGYQLKIDSAWMTKTNASLYRDFGGYGILAPEITRETVTT